MTTRFLARLSVPALWMGALTIAANGQPKQIDVEKSAMTVRVYKAGVLGALGHDHEIAAPVARGTVDVSAHQVKVYVKTGALKVRDPGTAEKERGEIQSTMLGPEVLAADQNPEIAFVSTSAERGEAGSWSVRGNLTLHGQARPVVVQVREAAGGHYTGSVAIKQTEFGIQPIKKAGGSIRVKDEVRIEFDIQLAR